MRKQKGNSLRVGKIVDTDDSLTLSPSGRSTHLYCVGSTGTGKSKFLENLIRQDIKNWPKSKCGMILLDPHGSLYDSLISWAAFHNLNRPIVPIDLRSTDHIIGYNVLRNRPNMDPAVVVANFVQAMAHVWGQGGTDQTPLFARWAGNILRTLYDNKATLIDAEVLLDHAEKHFRYEMMEAVNNRSVTRDWQYANTLSPKDFEAQISSTVNRLHRFLENQTMRTMFGQRNASLDLGKAMEEGWIVLVNLATEKGRVSEEDASLFGTLLLSDLWTAAKERGKGSPSNPVKPFYVYVDEFQNFVTPTIAKNLDQARGFGLHLTLAHQFPNQLLHAGAHGKQVLDSIMVNARSKVVFQVEGEENLRPLAQSLFMGTMDPEKIKHELYSTKVMEYREELRKTHSFSATEGSSKGRNSRTTRGGSQTGAIEEDEFSIHTESTSEGDGESESESESFSHSVTLNHALIPVLGTELTAVQYQPLDEQLFMAMAALFDQEQRHCVARLAGMKSPLTLVSPTLLDTPSTAKVVKMYSDKLLEKWPFAIHQGNLNKTIEAPENLKTAIVLPRNEPESHKRIL